MAMMAALSLTWLDLNDILVSCTLTAARKGFAVVRLMNPTNGPVTLQSGVHIDKFSLVFKEDIVLDCTPLQPTSIFRVDMDQTHITTNSSQFDQQLQEPFDVSGEHFLLL